MIAEAVDLPAHTVSAAVGQHDCYALAAPPTAGVGPPSLPHTVSSSSPAANRTPHTFLRHFRGDHNQVCHILTEYIMTAIGFCKQTEMYIMIIIIFFFRSPAISLGFTTFWVRFLRMWPFFNPTTKVVTFCLRGWCVLGVFLLPAFTRLGHERQDLLSPCDEMHVCTN